MPSKKVDRNTWLAERRKGIGSSDAAAVLNMSRFKTALEVQLDKLSPEPIQEKEESDLLELGLMFEPIILKLYERKTGVKPRRVNRILTHPKYKFMVASLDALVGSPQHPLEIKNLTFPKAAEWGDEGSDNVPDEYVIQTQHQMAVTDTEYVELPVLLYGKLRIYRVDRNERLIAAMIEREQEFWTKHIINQEPVPPDFQHPRTPEIIRHMYGVAPDKSIALGIESAPIVGLYQELGSKQYELDKKREALKAEILHLMGDAELAELPNGTVLTRKYVHRDAYSVAESEYIQLRVRKSKANKEIA